MKRFLFLGLLLLMPLRAEDVLDAEYASQTGTAITIIFDNSGSMEGEKIRDAKQAFKWWLEKAPDSYTWSLIDFDNSGTILVPFTAHARQKVADEVNKLRARTNTPIVSSLRLARQQIEDYRKKVSPYQRQVVLLFTDGEENVDPGGNEAVLNTIREMRALQIEVVGIGYYKDGDYIRQAATRFFPAGNEQALRSGLSQVDAEVDLGGEVNVTPEDLKAMAALPTKTPAEQRLESGTDNPPTQPIVPHKQKKEFFSPGTIFIIIVVAVIAMIFRGGKSKAKRRR